jgi:hypothetical protein
MDSIIFAIAILLSIYVVVANISMIVNQAITGEVSTKEFTAFLVSAILTAAAWGVYHYLSH